MKRLSILLLTLFPSYATAIDFGGVWNATGILNSSTCPMYTTDVVDFYRVRELTNGRVRAVNARGRLFRGRKTSARSIRLRTSAPIEGTSCFLGIQVRLSGASKSMARYDAAVGVACTNSSFECSAGWTGVATR